MENAINHTLTLLKRQTLSLTGITEVISVSESCLVCNLSDGNLIVTGDNLKVSKLDVESGNMELNGNVCSIKYGGKSKQKENFLKKLFK